MSFPLGIGPAEAALHPAAWAVYTSGGRWKPAPHLVYLAALLLKVEAGEIKRLAVSMPPRHGKSELISKYFASWWLGRHPSDRVVLTSYGADLVRQWTRASRDNFAEFAPEVFGVDTWQRAKALEWDVFRDGRRTGGGMYGCGRGGALTGRGADIIFVDDPVKDATEANSPAVRDNTWDWLTSVPFTRLEPDGKIVLIQTRWNFDDPIGRVIERAERGDGEPWHIVNFPAIATEHDELGREPGEALWPARFDLEALGRIRREVGGRVWEALYQGNPVPDAGAIYKREWFKYLPQSEIDRRRDLVYFSTSDLAVSANDYADFSATAVFAADLAAGELFVVDVRRGRLEAPALLREWEKLRERYDLPAVYVEKTAFNLQLCQLAAAQGIPIRWLKADRDKVARAQPACAVFEQGRIYFSQGTSWLPMLERELLRFPASRHDDLSDVIAYGVRVFLSLLRRRGDRGPQLPRGFSFDF